MKKTLNLLGIVVITVIGFSFTACSDNPSGKSVCTNPAGTIFLVGETHPDTKACGCEKNVPGQRVEGIAVTNREGVVNFPAMVTEFTEALSWLTPTQLAWVKANLNKEVKIINGNDVINAPSGGILTITNARSASDIYGALELWLFYNSISMMYDQVKNIIYVTKKDTSFMELFDNSKETVRAAFAAVRYVKTI